MRIVIFYSFLAGLSVAGRNNRNTSNKRVKSILIISYLFVITVW